MSNAHGQYLNWDIRLRLLDNGTGSLDILVLLRLLVDATHLPHGTFLMIFSDQTFLSSTSLIVLFVVCLRIVSTLFSVSSVPFRLRGS
jgi:hypothetical protein